MNKRLLILLILVPMLSCREGGEVIVPDNYAEPYAGVSTIKVENYLNRVYIDLLGREPLDAELKEDVAFLREGELGSEQREKLVSKLMTDTQTREGDSSYQIAYYKRVYELTKARLLEGVSNEEISRQRGIFRFAFVSDSLNGNQIGMLRNQLLIDKLDMLRESEIEYREGSIHIDEVYRRMLDNFFYDEINMNTINFIRACFDNLFFRQPTQAEFDQSFPIIEYNSASSLFGQSASTKDEYIHILLSSAEFYEGMIRWVYVSLLAREPSSEEVKEQMDAFFLDKNLQTVQQSLLISDEYANF
ncbi:MAG: hypothetical protein AAF587_40440 [Bacteroidota bacterium]